ncbi:serine hydrolase [Bacillus atrophaeus]|uniref:serine hydrolase n=1 Tax=Bacillus atrophaeus TaxID=1452 RepID=UPI002E1E2099|nr:serine hydrolase [Bacillus atrophaeus]
MFEFTIIIGVLILTIGVVIVLYFKKVTNNPFVAIDYAKKRKENKDVSLIITRNQTELISINPNITMPLASTVKIIVAIEFTRQASENIIDVNTSIPNEKLLKYYLEGTDGGAHKLWIEKFNDKPSYTLKEIAIGMIAFSSNANTEFLMDYLGLKSINEVPETLNLSHHTMIFPIVSSLYIPSYISQIEKIKKKDQLLKRLIEMPEKEYIDYSLTIHEHLKNEEKHEYMEKVYLEYEFQKVWSERLPAGSASDYLKVMRMINCRKQFNHDMQNYLEELLGYALFSNVNNRKWIERGGFKGGSTLFVFTYASFSTDKDGHQTELVFFSNNLNALTAKRLQLNFNQFVLNTLTDESFRKKLINK